MSGLPERALDWLDERTGLRRIVRSQLTEYFIPATVNRWYSLGFVLLAFVALQLLTGALLLIYYIPSASHAFESVQRIMHDVPFGWLVRLLHVHGANAMVIVLGLHMLTVVVTQAYKRPRELHWLTGTLLLLTTLFLCFTGYVLPWSQLSYWATTVGMNIMGSLPGIGPVLQQYFQGGDVVGPLTLGRAFGFHVAILPTVLVSFIVCHLYLVRFTGISAPPQLHPRPVAKTRRFFPDFFLEDVIVATAVMAIFSAVLFFEPHLYLPEDAFEKADPFNTPEHVKPEWYFLASYAALRLIPNKTLGILVQILAIVALMALPFLDRGEKRHILRRPLLLAAVAGAVVAVVALTIYGAWV